MKIDPILIRLPVKFGLFGLLLTVLAFLVFYYAGLMPWRNLVSLILDTLLVGAFCFVAIKEFKTNYNGGILSFYHGMTLGFVTYVIIALGFGVFYRFFIDIVEPDFISNYITLAKEDMVSRKILIVASLGEESYDKNFIALETTSSGVLMLDAIIKKALIGLFLTPIFSVILRTHLAK